MSTAPPRTLWRGWRHLSGDERISLCLAAVAVPVAHLTLRLAGFHRVLRWVERTSAPPTGSPRDALRTSVVSVNRVQRYSLFPGNCLSRSLSLAWLMRRRGLAPTLRLGVKRSGSLLDAHAWVEFESRVLNDTPDVGERYARLVANQDSKP